MITRMDEGVGRIFESWQRLGIDEQTIVFFSSDNGPPALRVATTRFFDSNRPLQGYKRLLHDGGIRVPVIVRWPDRVPAGTTSDLAWRFADFLPTAAE